MRETNIRSDIQPTKNITQNEKREKGQQNHDHSGKEKPSVLHFCNILSLVHPAIAFLFVRPPSGRIKLKLLVASGDLSIRSGTPEICFPKNGRIGSFPSYLNETRQGARTMPVPPHCQAAAPGTLGPNWEPEEMTQERWTRGCDA